MVVRTLVIGLLLLGAGCREDSGMGPEQRQLHGPLTVKHSALFVSRPEIDGRIEKTRVSSDKVRVEPVYPDLALPDMRAIRDFAVDARRLYMLVASRDTTHSRQLQIFDLSQGQRDGGLKLNAAPDTLDWSSSGELLVCHVTGEAGAAGRLTVIDTQNDAILTQVALDGACVSVVGDRSHAFAVQKMTRSGPNDEPLLEFRLLDINLHTGAVARRLPLPAGARQVLIGPGGFLYVSHASGLGIYATDGTISVVDPVDWRVIHRIRLDMIVRKMTTWENVLLLNMISSGGESWFGAILPDFSTWYDFKLPELVTGELAVVDGTAYLPLRGADAFFTIRVDGRPTVERIRFGPKRKYADRPGMIRVKMEPYRDY